MSPGFVGLLAGMVALLGLIAHTLLASLEGEELVARQEQAGLLAALKGERGELERSLQMLAWPDRDAEAGTEALVPALSEIMAGLAGREDIEAALVLDESNRLLRVWRNGWPIPTGGFAGPAVRLGPVAARARQAPGRPFSDFVTTPFGPAVVAAAAPPFRSPGNEVVVLVRFLETALLQELEERLLLTDLKIAGGAARPRSLELEDGAGEPVTALAWSGSGLHAQLLSALAPSLLAILLLFLAGSLLALVKLRRAANAVRMSEARFRDIAEVASDWIFETDRELRLTFVSPGPYARGESRPEPPVGLAVSEVVVEDADGSRRQLLEAMRARLPIREMLIRTSHRGVARMLRLNAVPVTAPETGIFLGYRGTARDVTQELEARARAEFLAYHDQVTGLPNRTMLARHSMGLKRRAAVLALDLDRFKAVNDTLGHAAGDALLVECAQRLRDTLDPEDFVARVGGDEFVALHLLGDGDAERVASLCGDLIRALSRPYQLDGRQAVIGVSIGVAMLTPTVEPLAEVLQKADAALYRAKSTGRGQVRFHEPGMEVALRQRRQMERELREAVESDALFLHYQPKFDIATGRISGVEALLRWTHPARGPVSPELFVPLAEEVGLMDEIGARVLRRACREAAAWGGLPIAVNLSPAQFRLASLADTVRDAITEAGLPRGCLELEITENLLLSDQEGLLETLQQLRELGACITMDDFGTGYSSLGYLQRFQFDKIKIDRLFVARLGERGSGEAIVRAIVALGRSLGVAVCAEGVEEQAQLDLLAELGCHEAQGFLLGRPVPPTEIAARLHARPRLTLVGGSAGKSA
ncbi:EAL domain-containing protein [Geminicoccaceae bacterium 1502E]|nr:EAL domain-containing protein [Geminicoccaceae bacterium 1502E]